MSDGMMAGMIEWPGEGSMNRIALILGLLWAGVASAAGAPVEAGSTLTPRAMLQLAPRPRVEFVSEWDRLRQAEIAALEGLDSPEARQQAMLRIQFRYAQGRVMYPFFHWRESDAAAIEPDSGLGEVLSALPRIDARLWELVEVREFVDAYLHERARARLAADLDLASGDARWLRAELRALDEVLPDEPLRKRKAADIIAKHIDDDGAGGVEEAIRDWRADSPPAETLRKIDDAIAADRARAAGENSVVYRRVSGVPLHLHLRHPATHRSRPAAAMLWLHGGSATEGTWWHSPVTTQALLDAGVVVIGVELTTGNRFDRDADQVSDAAAAFDYVRRNARKLGIDARKIGVAGFSSGASVALLLATRGAAPSSADARAARRYLRPAAVIVSGACADPLSEGSDGYFRKSVSAGRDPADLSPLAQVRAGGPPVLAVHGAADEYCPFADMARFAERYRDLGNEITLVSVENASHFFGFFHEPGQRAQRQAIFEALERWDW
jgi:acetyl esterase